MSDPKGKPSAKGDDKGVAKDEEETEAKRRGWVRWTLGWVVTPGVILGSIFAAGALVGAHMSESWFSRAVMWIAGLF